MFSKLVRFVLILQFLNFHIQEVISETSEPSPCPDPSILLNCTCIQTREVGAMADIHCSGPDTSLPDLIIALDVFLPDDKKEFGRLLLDSKQKFDLGDKFFRRVTFREVRLGTSEKECMVERVYPGAFEGRIASTLERFLIRSDALSYNADMFAALLPLKNLRSVAIEGRFMTHIPKLAFCEDVRSEVSSFPLLEEISFHASNLGGIIFARSVGPRAFWNLPALKSVSISNQDLQKVGVRAFGLPVPSSVPLKIDLTSQWNEKFTGDSFLPDTFADLNRPVELDLYSNPNLSYLPEATFRKFLEQNPDNRIRLGQEMICDCKMAWLVHDKDKFKHQFIEWHHDDTDYKRMYFVHCKYDDVDLFELDSKRFQRCDALRDEL